MTTTILTDHEIHDEYLRTTGHKSIPPVNLDFARAIEQSVLSAYESQLLRLLVDIRFAAGDDGKRMQDELVEHIAGLRKDSEILAWVLKQHWFQSEARFRLGEEDLETVADVKLALSKLVEKQP